MPGNDSIRYIFDSLDQYSVKMGNIAEATDDILSSLTSLRDGVDSFWQGKAQKAYIERTNTVFNQLKQLYEEITESRKKLDTAITLMRGTEEDNSADVNKLSDDDIF